MQFSRYNKSLTDYGFAVLPACTSRSYSVHSGTHKDRFSIVIDQTEARPQSQVKQLLQLLNLPAAKPGLRQGGWAVS